MNQGPTPTIPDHDPLRLIGRGSYGEVWLGRNALGTQRAIKIVRRASFDSDRPYAREFSGIQKFEPVSRSHDGLVDILQVGRNDPAGFFYYVMELADPAGSPDPDVYVPRTLAEVLKARLRLPAAEVVPLFIALASALGHLHRHGLLHRDVKPANVIFVGGVAKLADIGLVAEAGDSGTFVGTEGFIPPEGPGTVSADLYALGKTMYEAATGRDRNEFPALPLERHDEAQNTALLELNAVLLKCCDRDPRQRYPSAAALIADLELLGAGHSVTRLRQYERRLAVARRLGVIALVVLAASIWAGIFARRGERIAQENFRKSEALRQRAEHAEREANDRLYSSLLARAAAERQSGRSGARGRALAAIRQAGILRPGAVELRNEAIAALALTDIEEVRNWPARPTTHRSMAFAPDLSYYVRYATNGTVEICDPATDAVVDHWAVPGPAWVGLPVVLGDTRWILAYPEGDTVQLWDRRDHSLEGEWPAASNTRVYAGSGVPILALRRSREFEIRRLDREEIHRLPEPWAYADATPSQTGKWIAIHGRETNAVRIVDLATGRTVRTFAGTDDTSTMSVAWSADDRRLAANGRDHHVRIFDLDGPRDTPALELRGHQAEVVGSRWSPRGDLLVTSGWDSTTRIWETHAGREVARLPYAGTAFGFTPDQHRFGCAAPDAGRMVLSEVRHREVCRLFEEAGPRDEKSPLRVAFSRDGGFLFTGGFNGLHAYRVSDGTVSGSLDLPSVQQLFLFPPPSRAIVAVTTSARLRTEWSTNASGGIDFSPPRDGVREELARDHPTGRPWLGNMGSVLRIFRADGRTIDLPDGTPPSAVAVSEDGRFAAATRLGGPAMLWEVGPPAVTHPLGPARAFGIAFSPDSRRCFHAVDRDLVCTDTATARTLWRTELSDIAYPNAGIRVSPDGRFVATTMDSYSVSLVEAGDGRLVAVFRHPDEHMPNGVDISSDGRYLAVASGDHLTQIWDLTRLRAELDGLKLDW